MGTTLARTISRTQTLPPNIPFTSEPVDPRFAFTGDSVAAGIDPSIRMNRPVRHKHRSPFKGMFIVLSVSLLIVFYIWNKIRVQELTGQVADMRNQYQKAQNVNEILRAEITQKSRLDRIERLAVDQLKMTYPKEQPTWFAIEGDKQKAAQ